MDIFEKDSIYLANTYQRFPVALKSGKGSLVYDIYGNEYIDLSTGIAVNTFGVADEEWIKAVTKQLSAIQHSSNLYYTSPCVDLAEVLCLRTGHKKVFFSNSGAEANECAVKVARKYASDKKGKDYNVIVTLKNSFHGRTITTLAATGQDVFHNDFLPLTDGFVYCDAGDTAQLKNLVKKHKVCAIMFELVQGEGGVVPLTQNFVDDIFKIAEENDILTIADEVQTGNGRTGELYAFMKYGVMPDIVSTAKGLGNGLPLGATLLGEKTKNVLTFSSHGSTFGGNPVACAGALNVINRIDRKLLESVNKKSELIVNSLKNADGVKSVSGMGLMLGIEIEKDIDEVINYCIQNGVLVIKAKNKLRILPALNISFELLEKALKIIKEGCAL